MKRRKTIDELYRETRDFDLVLVPDAALAEALNRRIDRPRLGPFALTLKDYARKAGYSSGLGAFADEIDMVRQIAETSGYKRAHYYVTLLSDCWLQTGRRPGRMISMPHFMKIPEHACHSFEKWETYYSRLEKLSFEGYQKIAVIESELFYPLERQALPGQAFSVSLFTEDECAAPSFCLFDGLHDLVQAVSRQITQENQQDVAIVTSTSEMLSNALKADLLARGFSLIGTKDILEDIRFRRTLSVLRMSHQPEILKISDIAGMLSLQGCLISPETYAYFVKDYPSDAPEADKVQKFYSDLQHIGGLTFDDFISAYAITYAGKYLKEIIEKYKMGRKIIQDSFFEFEYFLYCFGHDLDVSRQGIVFADAKNSLLVDRPVVFYIMPDNSWISRTSSRSWMEPDSVEKYKEDERSFVRDHIQAKQREQHKKNLIRFASLTQSGSKRYFMAVCEKERRTVLPCYYFRETGLMQASRFDDPDIVFHEYSAGKEKKERDLKTPLPKDKDDKRKARVLSNSSLRAFILCPRKYAFSRLVSVKVNEAMARGNLLHQFAEFYVLYPQMVKRRGLRYFVDIMMQDMNPLLEDFRSAPVRTTLEKAAGNVMAYIDSLSAPDLSFSCKKDERNKKNIFLEKLKKEIKKEKPQKACSEYSFYDPDLLIKGRIDLLVSETEIVDYKTSSHASSPSVLLSRADRRGQGDDLDFQSFFYLSALHAGCPEKELKMHYVYPAADIACQMAGNRMDKPRTEAVIIYKPYLFQDYIVSHACFEELCDTNRERKSFLEKITFENYSSISRFSVIFEAQNKFELLQQNGAESFIAHCLAFWGKDNITARRKAEGILKKLFDIRKSYIFQEDLENFQDFVKNISTQISRCLTQGFPRKPVSLSLCRTCDFNDICEVSFQL